MHCKLGIGMLLVFISLTYLNSLSKITTAYKQAYNLLRMCTNKFQLFFLHTIGFFNVYWYTNTMVFPLTILIIWSGITRMDIPIKQIHKNYCFQQIQDT